MVFLLKYLSFIMAVAIPATIARIKRVPYTIKKSIILLIEVKEIKRKNKTTAPIELSIIPSNTLKVNSITNMLSPFFSLLYHKEHIYDKQ